jgi:DNA-binding MarR family transcriptional regulator
MTLQHDNRSPGARPADPALASGLERTMHTLSKRVYAPTVRALYQHMYRNRPAGGEKLDRGSIIVLATLEDRGRLRSSELAAIVDLDLSTVSRHVSYFEQLGLIEREPDPVDRRASQISITEQGRAGLAAIRDARAALLDSVFASWSAADRAEFQRLLDRLARDLSELPNPLAHKPGPSPSNPSPSNPSPSNPSPSDQVVETSA